ncbi:MAG: class I SAM-dependent methyltransferase [Thaumarchaeota archaeon]|nr:class I SAM-dependent methyltransferase [Nitrososphaerota archaeon]
MTSFFNESYKGTPPWDLGRPQAEFVRLVKDGKIRGRTLDVGCGTGENAMLFAGLGLEVWGLDGAPLAIEKAKRKASERGSTATFLVGDALRLETLNQRFDTITDSGPFHVFSDEERILFVKSLRSALNKGGTYLMLCFSDKEPAGWGGPRRVSQEEIRATFTDGWKIDWIREARFESTFHEDGGRALLSSITSV